MIIEIYYVYILKNFNKYLFELLENIRNNYRKYLRKYIFILYIYNYIFILYLMQELLI